MSFLDQKKGLTPLEKSQFFDFKTSFFYNLQRRVFVLEYRQRYFPGLYRLKRKSCNNGHFWIKTMEESRISIFRLFELLVLIA